MKLFAIAISILLLNNILFAQNDTLSIRLSAFTKREGQSEILYVGVFIKSNVRDTVEIDDSRYWIKCANAFGVKLFREMLRDDCYEEMAGECLPEYSSNEDIFSDIRKSVKLRGFSEYSYIVTVGWVSRVEPAGLKMNINPYRFRLELPYRLGGRWSKAKSKGWVYYAYPG